jgi:hypothetical protein
VSKAPLDIRSLARKHTKESVDRLAFWMRSDNPKGSVAASVALLDRGWGKPTQTIAGPDEGAIKIHNVIEYCIVDPPKN